jgi:hypothetical protein
MYNDYNDLGVANFLGQQNNKNKFCSSIHQRCHISNFHLNLAGVASRAAEDFTALLAYMAMHMGDPLLHF